jgi:hypothetical protein
MKTTIFLVAFVVLAIPATIEALSCLSCEEVTCTPANELKCKGGLTRGICGCCDVCAKVGGEKCGGLWNMHGTCDSGLRCYKGRKVIIPYGVGVCISK